jgi:hypothetical protein
MIRLPAYRNVGDFSTFVNRGFSLSSTKETEAAVIAANPLRRRLDRSDLLGLVDRREERRVYICSETAHQEADVKARRPLAAARNMEVGGSGGYGRMGTCGRPPAGRRTTLRSGRGAVLSRSRSVSCHYAHRSPLTKALTGASASLKEESGYGG